MIALDHPAIALDRLAEQYRGQPNLAALITAACGEATQLEAALLDLLDLRPLDVATDEALDVLGRVLLQARAGLTDAEYRIALRARIRVLVSSGTTEDLLSIVVLLLPTGGTARVSDSGTASVVCAMGGAAPAHPELIGALLRAAKAAGVRLVFEFLGSSEATAFRYDAGPGYDTGHYGGAV